MKKLILLSIAAGAMLVMVGCNRDEVVSDVVVEEKGFVFEEDVFDFGVIKQSGGLVSHEFPFVYHGEPIVVEDTPASCECTKAEIDKFEFKDGDRGVLRVEFNPNLHKEPDGRFFKTASIVTEPVLGEMPEVKIWAKIDLDLGEDAFELKGDHDDDDEYGEYDEH